MHVLLAKGVLPVACTIPIRRTIRGSPSSRTTSDDRPSTGRVSEGRAATPRPAPPAPGRRQMRHLEPRLQDEAGLGTGSVDKSPHAGPRRHRDKGLMHQLLPGVGALFRERAILAADSQERILEQRAEAEPAGGIRRTCGEAQVCTTLQEGGDHTRIRRVSCSSSLGPAG